MDEYGLALEPEHPDETFEALSNTVGDKVFTLDEAVECIRDVLNVSRQTAFRRFENLVRNSNITNVSRTNVLPGEYYADLDESTGLYHAFHSETGKAQGSFSGLEEAEEYAAELNQHQG